MKKFLILSILLMALGGCQTSSSSNVLPVYPKARSINSPQSSGDVEVEGAVVHVASYEVWEHIDPVGQFYNEKLNGEGWRGRHKKGQEMTIYTDDKLSLDRTLDSAKPKDASTPGHAVLLAKMEGRTMIRLFWSEPKP